MIDDETLDLFDAGAWNGPAAGRTASMEDPMAGGGTPTRNRKTLVCEAKKNHQKRGKREREKRKKAKEKQQQQQQRIESNAARGTTLRSILITERGISGRNCRAERAYFRRCFFLFAFDFVVSLFFFLGVCVWGGSLGSHPRVHLRVCDRFVMRVLIRFVAAFSNGSRPRLPNLIERADHNVFFFIFSRKILSTFRLYLAPFSDSTRTFSFSSIWLALTFTCRRLTAF